MADDADLVVQYTESQLELLDANCRTAVPFDEDHSLIEEMGRRAKAKRRAARRATSEDVDTHVSTAVESLSEETDCEIPSVTTAVSPSKIPVLQKGYVAQKSTEKSDAVLAGSKIPIPTKPKAQLVYLPNLSELAYSTCSSIDEPPSFTPSSASFIHETMMTDINSATIPPDLTPLPRYDTESEYCPSSVEDPNRVQVVAEANGLEMKLDMTAMLKGLDLEMVGIRFL